MHQYRRYSHVVRVGQGIIVISITLLMLGVVMVSSAGMQVSSEPLTLKTMLMSRPTMLALVAMVAMYAGTKFPMHLLERKYFSIPLVLWLVPITILLLMAVYIPGIGKEMNSSNRWVEVGGFNFQPSEIAKWVMVLVIAWWGSAHIDSMKTYWKGFIPPVFGLGLIAAIIAVEDLGTAVLIFGAGCIVFLAAGSRLWHFASLLPLMCGAFFVAVYSNQYRIGRLQAYLHPFDDPEKTGYHILQSMTTISGGGLAGQGLGNGIHKFGYLPEDTTDFIFSVICEELGIFGALAVVSLYIGVVVLGVHVIRKTTNAFHQLLTLGIITTIGLQASMNILVVTALVPTKGIALPLLSNGGTGWLLTAFCIGLIEAIDKKNDVHSIPYAHQHSIPITRHV